MCRERSPRDAQTPKVRSGSAGPATQRAVPRGLPSPRPPPSPEARRRPRHGEARTRGAGPRSARELPARAQGVGCGEGGPSVSPEASAARAWVAGRYPPPARRLRRAGCSFRWSRDARGRVESCGARRAGCAGNRRRDVERGGRGRPACTEPGCLCALRRASQGPRSRSPWICPFHSTTTRAELVSPVWLSLLSLQKAHGGSTLGDRRAALPPEDPHPTLRAAAAEALEQLGSADPAGPGWRLSTRLPAPRLSRRPRRVVGAAGPGWGRFGGEVQGLPADTRFPQRSALNPPPAGTTIGGRVGRSRTVCRESPAASGSWSKSQIPGGNRGGGRWRGGMEQPGFREEPRLPAGLARVSIPPRESVGAAGWAQGLSRS